MRAAIDWNLSTGTEVEYGFVPSDYSEGVFVWPQVRPGEVKVSLTPEEFMMLIGGMDLQAAKPRPWYRKELTK